MKKSKISKVLLLGASALLLTSITACGDDKSNQPAEGNSNVDTGTETTPSTNNSGNQENNSGTGEGQSQGQQGQENQVRCPCFCVPGPDQRDRQASRVCLLTRMI